MRILPDKRLLARTSYTQLLNGWPNRLLPSGVPLAIDYSTSFEVNWKGERARGIYIPTSHTTRVWVSCVEIL